jgi:hypothetical protein
MTQLTLFAIEILIGLFSAGVVAGVLTRPLRRLLVEACGTTERARFWVLYSDVMLFLAPLVAIAMLGKSGDVFTPTVAYCKAALGSALAGIFVALAVIGYRIASLLPPRPSPVESRRLVTAERGPRPGSPG